MSKILQEFLEREVLPQVKDNALPAPLQEELMTSEGWLDRGYICARLGIILSTKTFAKTVRQTLGGSKLLVKPVVSEITQEEFLDIYEFGKFANPRQWVGYVYNEYGKIITRADCLQFIYSAGTAQVAPSTKAAIPAYRR